MHIRRWATRIAVALLLGLSSLVPPAGAEPRGFEIYVDRRVELASTLLTLTSWARDGGELPTSTYAADTLAAFTRYRSHPSVKLVDDFLASETGHVGVLLRVAMLLSSSLGDHAPIPPALARECGGAEVAESLASALAAFATETGYGAYYDRNIETYAKLEDRVLAGLKRSDPVTRLENYFGASYTRYVLMLAPLIPRTADLVLEAEPTRDGPLAVLRPYGTTKDKQPDFRETSPGFARDVEHAWGHTFVDPLTAKYELEVQRATNLFAPIAGDMAAYRCRTWGDAFSEHLLRALDARYLQEEGEGKLAQMSLRNNERAGFAYVREFFNQLASYEADRKTYPSMEAFYPTLLAQAAYLCDTGADQDVAKRYASFQGPLWRAFDTRFVPAMALVKPTPLNATTKATLDTYVATVKEYFKKRYRVDLKIVTGVEAAELPKDQTVFLILGTPGSNPFLSALMKYIPLKVGKDNIQVGGKQFFGKNLRLVTTFSNPYNRTLPMVIYTSSEDQGTVGMFGLPRGPYDYMVFQDMQAIAQGDYVYDLKGRWSVP